MNSVRRLTALFTLALLGALAACTSTPPARQDALPSVSGTVSFRERVAMPPGAVLELRLVDFTVGGAPAVLVKELGLSNPGNPPVKFRLHYDPRVIDPRRDYAVEARIVVNGRPRWIQRELAPVITKSRPFVVDLVLAPPQHD